MSAHLCGCDPEENNHHCENYPNCVWGRIVAPPAQAPADGFVIKDSGKREQYAGGMQRDVSTDKIDYSLVLDGPMFARFAEHLRKGAVKYGKRNWLKAQGAEELDRFRESAFRHFLQWYFGETDEDHASAVFFNINGVEYVKEKLK